MPFGEKLVDVAALDRFHRVEPEPRAQAAAERQLLAVQHLLRLVDDQDRAHRRTLDMGAEAGARLLEAGPAHTSSRLGAPGARGFQGHTILLQVFSTA